jgi:hypothetical protein
MNNFGASTPAVSNFLSAIHDAPCWGVRSEMDDVLVIEFGAPFLTIREPSALPPDASPATRKVLERRIVIPTGRWHLFVEDGVWRIAAGGSTCARSETDAAKQATCFAQLNGQRLTRFAWSPADRLWRLDFDLGGSLTIAEPAGEAPQDQWSVFREDGTILACVQDETLVWVHGLVDPIDASGTAELSGP